MGLDMYLEARVGIPNKKFFDKGAKINFNIGVEPNVPLPNSREILEKFKKPDALVYELGYWRKASQVHAWFVQNTQDGVDDCRETHVSYNQIQELLDTCNTVLDARKTDAANNNEVTKSKLPTEVGFFFGSADYSDDYYQQLEDTVVILKKCIEFSDLCTELGVSCSFYYSSSW